MGTKSEAILEKELIEQLVAQGYASVTVSDEAALLANLKIELGKFNNTIFSDKELETILIHLEKGNVFQKAKTLRDRFVFTRDDETDFYVRFFNSEDPSQNRYQVTNQISQEGKYKNRYDVTILVNGLPLVQIELKRPGLEIKEAFNQINRYQRDSFWSNRALFQYVQLFVISNGVTTKYLGNNRLQSVKQTFYWANKENRNIKELSAFAADFLAKEQLGKMLSKYIVLNETHKVLMAMRPYQVYATEAILRQIKESTENGYIWHTTGSGKTLTSFKTSQLALDIPEVHKVVFVVDRKDLDYQTMKEFNAFKSGSVDSTEDTKNVINQLLGKYKDKNDVAKKTDLIITTIQKLRNAVSGRNAYTLSSVKDKRIVFIFDECHRSQFGDTHKDITSFFTNAQLFGFTGTPIFAENSYKNEHGKRTTKDLFGNCLHKYVITDAIRDENVLRFGIEYFKVFKQKKQIVRDQKVEDIDRAEVYDSAEYHEEVANHIIQYHNQKTFNKEFSALFAVSSIESLIKYYNLFKAKKEAGEHDLRIATVYSYGVNENDENADDSLPSESYGKAAEPKVTYSKKWSSSRDKLEEYLGDYNAMYGTNYTTKDTKSYDGYAKDISRRLKEREKEDFDDIKDRLDIVIVVSMMLTGFDAKKVNTLYVDKNLQEHGLIQAYSRTNRIIGEKKSQGNILCFRNLKKATDDAITMFSNKDAIEVVVLPEFEKVLTVTSNAIVLLKQTANTYKVVDDFESEKQEEMFVKAFRGVLRALNVLQSYTDFSWDDLTLDEEEFEKYKSKYHELYKKVKAANAKQKDSILDDIDFELELIHRDKITVAYIIMLLAKIKDAKPNEKEAKKKALEDLISGNIDLVSKLKLIKAFVEKNLPKLDENADVESEFDEYWKEQKVMALDTICEEEGLDRQQFAALIEAYIFSGQEPLKDDILLCLANRPSILQARSIGERIIQKMREFIEVYVEGMAA